MTLADGSPTASINHLFTILEISYIDYIYMHQILVVARIPGKNNIPNKAVYIANGNEYSTCIFV